MKIQHLLLAAIGLATLLAGAADAQRQCLPLEPRLAAMHAPAGGARHDFLGRAMLVKAFHPDRDVDLVKHATWAMEITTEVCRRCERQAPRLEELREAHAAAGLDVLCVTGDREQPARRWMEVNRVRGAWAVDEHGDLLDVVDPQRRCEAVLADANGRIVWRGDVLRLEGKVLEAALAEAFAEPMHEWKGGLDGVRQALRRGEWTKAIERARGVDAAAALAAKVERQLDGTLELFERAAKEGDWLAVSARGAELQKALLGDARRARVLELLDGLEADRAAQRVLKAQRQVRDARAMQLTRGRERGVAKARMEAICAEHDGTAAASDARVLLARIARIETEARGMR
jgi:hypothetical protein